jgi:hypothetical protein
MSGRYSARSFEVDFNLKRESPSRTQEPEYDSFNLKLRRRPKATASGRRATLIVIPGLDPGIGRGTGAAKKGAPYRRFVPRQIAGSSPAMTV